MESEKELESNLQILSDKLVALHTIVKRVGGRGHMEGGKWLEKLIRDVNNLEEEVLLIELRTHRFQQFTPADIEEFTKQYFPVAQGVYRGKLYGELHIDVKVLENKDITLNKDRFMAEVRAMISTSVLSHPNLIKLYGFCFTDEVKALVYMSMENGSLDEYLYSDESSGRIIEWGKLYEIAMETAWGLLYLHEGFDDRIIHGDVKPANVLLDSDFCPKLTNFGVAKLTTNRDSETRGTLGFAAPELWIPESPVTYKCDVYSFGMMLFEILGRRKNLSTAGKWFPIEVVEMIRNSELNQLLDDCNITKKEDRGNAKILCVVALQCIQQEAESRPTMRSVMKMLEGEIKVTIPTKLSFPQPTPDVSQELNAGGAILRASSI